MEEVKLSCCVFSRFESTSSVRGMPWTVGLFVVTGCHVSVCECIAVTKMVEVECAVYVVRGLSFGE